MFPDASYLRLSVHSIQFLIISSNVYQQMVL